jgi:hypothetical protein
MRMMNNCSVNNRCKLGAFFFGVAAKNSGFAGQNHEGLRFCGRIQSVHGWTHYGSECVCECAPASEPQQDVAARRRTPALCPRLRRGCMATIGGPASLQSLARVAHPQAGVRLFRCVRGSYWRWGLPLRWEMEGKLRGLDFPARRPRPRAAPARRFWHDPGVLP